MERLDINRHIGEVFCKEPFALRIRKVCGNHEIVSVRDLCLHTNWDLLQFRYLSYKSITHIEDILGCYGLRLGMTEKELDTYMGIEPEEDKETAAILRFENLRQSGGSNAGTRLPKTCMSNTEACLPTKLWRKRKN